MPATKSELKNPAPMFRFTIRDLLWLMVVVRLGVGWWTQAEKAERLRLNLSGLIEIVNASGWIEIKNTGPYKYHVQDGNRAALLMEELKQSSVEPLTPK